MNIYKIYAIVGPWTTPAPAAIMLSIEAYREAFARSLNFYVALLAAFVALLALEAVGGLSTKEMLRRAISREWVWFSVSLIGVVFYAGLGVYVLRDSTSWIYVVLAVFVHIAVTGHGEFQEKQRLIANDREYLLKEKQMNITLERERTRQLNAEVRKVKATQNVTVATQNVTSPIINDLSLKADARALFDATPDISASDIARQLKADQKLRTIQRWVKEWRDNAA